MKRIAIALATAAIVASCTDTKDYDATGTFEPASEVTVSSEATGKIVSLTVNEGDNLKEGDLVGCIDTTQLYLNKLQLQRSASSVLRNRPNISSQVAALQEQIKKQEYERKRVVNLLADGAATQKQLDDIDSAIAVLKSQLEAQRTALGNTVGSLNEQSSSIDVQIAQIDDRIAKSRLTVPVSGIVTAKYAEQGEFAATGKPLYKIADMQHMMLRAYFTSEQLSQLKLGQEVTVTANFGGGSRYGYKGRIVWIAEQSEFTPKAIQTNDSRAGLVYAVKIAVNNDGRIKTGTYGEVKLKN